MRILPLLLIAVAIAAVEPIPVTTPAWSFRADGAWEVWWANAAKPKPFTLEVVPEGLRLSIAATTSKLDLNLWSERYKNRDPIGAPEAVLLDVDLVSGAADVGLDLHDAQREGLHYPDQPLTTGRQTLTWELAKAPQHTWGDQRNGRLDAPVGLWGLHIACPASSTPTVILLRSAQRRERAHPADLVAVTLDTGSPIHLLAPGRAPILALANRASAAVTVELTVSDEDWAGVIRRAKATVTVPASGALRWPLPEVPTARGIHWIECAIADVGEATPRVSERLPYALLDAPVERPQDEGFLFGVVGGLPGPGAHGEAYLPSAVETVRWLGLRNLRTGVNWEYVEKEPGQWDEQRLAWFSRGVDRFAVIGTRIQFLLAYTTRYAAAKEKQQATNHLEWMFSPPDLDAWRRYVATMVARYGDRVKLWEAWNEADIEFWRGSVEQYQQLLRVTREEVKRGDPTRRVMNSGFAFAWPRNGNPIAEVPYRVAKESRADYDILAYHLHHQFSEYRFIVEGWLADIRKQAGDPPLLFNECAVNLDVLGERGQAEQLPKKLLFAWSQGAIGYYWYNLTGGLRRPVPGNDANWGLMTDDFHPRAVFVAYHTLMGLLSDGVFRERYSTPAGRYAFRFDTPRGQVVAAWQEDSRGSQDPLVLAVGPQARCTLVDLMGVRTPLASDGGICLLPMSGTPAFVLIEQARTPVAMKKPLAQLPSGALAVPGRGTPVAIELANPFDRPLEIALVWELPPGCGPVAPRTATLAAGATQTVAMELPIARSFPARLGEVVRCTLRLDLAGTAHRPVILLPLSATPAIAAGAFDRPADFIRDGRAGLVDLHANVPQREARLWKGAQDLSWQAWVGRQGDRLAVKVVVRDDRHAQTGPAGQAWQSDSLQIALALPGGGNWWEFTYARAAADGAPLMACGMGPEGGKDPHPHLNLKTTRVGELTSYETSWPLDVLGLTPELLRSGLGFTLLVNDDDGEGRDGWLELAPGIGGQKDPKRFPLLMLD